MVLCVLESLFSYEAEPLYVALCMKKSKNAPLNFLGLKSTALLTFIAVIIHKDNLLQEVSWGVINSTVHGSQNHRQRFVHKDKNNGNLGQILCIFQLFAPATRRNTKRHWISRILAGPQPC